MGTYVFCPIVCEIFRATERRGVETVEWRWEMPWTVEKAKEKAAKVGLAPDDSWTGGPDFGEIDAPAGVE